MKSVALEAPLERRLKQQKTSETEAPDIYCNLDMLPGTSVNCKRLFSLAKHILTNTRKQTSASLFEALLLLKVNRKMWNEHSVSRAMGRSGEDCSDSDDNNNSGTHFDYSNYRISRNSVPPKCTSKMSEEYNTPRKNLQVMRN